MKKVILYLILWMASILIFVNPVQASSSYLDLNHLDFQAQINQDGSMEVTEKWNIRIEDTNTLYKTFKIDPQKYSSISNVKVTDLTNGGNFPFKQTNQWSYHLPKGTYFGGMNHNNQFEIAWGIGLGDKTATRVYTISYLVKDAIAKYNDYAELYWQFVGEDFEIGAKSITGTILLPKHVSNKEEIKVWGHTEDLNGTIYAMDTNKIEFNIQQFRSGRYVEIRTLFPTQMIANTARQENRERLEEVIQEETIWANQANQKREMRKITKIIISVILNIGAIILTIVSIKSTMKNIKKIKTSKKLVPTQAIQYFREMPREDATPAEALAVITQQVSGFNNSTYLGRIFSATLLDLSLKKIIDFEVQDKVITIKILKETPEELEKNRDEKEIFEFLKKATAKNQGKITTKELEKYIKNSKTKVITLGNTIDHATEQALYRLYLASEKGEKEKMMLFAYILILAIAIPFILCGFIMLIINSINALGLIPLFLAVIVQLVTVSVLFSKTNVLTQRGIDEKAKWKGLKKYMEDFSMLDKREIPEIVIWEKFLVYATVFGIANKVLKQLKIVYPNINEEWTSSHYGYIYFMMNTNFSSNFSDAISTSMSTAYSSATGGGGGFSGGGGGRTVDGGGGGGR